LWESTHTCFSVEQKGRNACRVRTGKRREKRKKKKGEKKRGVKRDASAAA